MNGLSVRIEIKRILSLLLGICLLIGLTACSQGSAGESISASAESEKKQEFELLRSVTTTTVTGGSSQEMVYGLEYDSRGLVTAVSVESGTEKQHVTASYSFDDHDNPSGFVMDMDGSSFSVVIENRYENGLLVEAMITDALIDGESVMESYLADEDSGILGSAFLQIIQHYTGYRDCVLRIKGTEAEYRYQNGKLTSQREPISGRMRELLTEYGSDGSVRSTTTFYTVQNGEDAIETSFGTLTDAEQYIREIITGIGSSGETARITLRYENAKDSGTGSDQRIGYVDSVDLPDSGNGAADSTNDFSGIPVLIYTLDADGSISRQEQSTEFLQMMGGTASGSATIWFEHGRVIRQETVTRSNDLTVTTVVENEYR